MERQDRASILIRFPASGAHVIDLVALGAQGQLAFQRLHIHE
jgi:hypothetical protein